MKVFAIIFFAVLVACVSADEAAEGDINQIIDGLEKFPDNEDEVNALFANHELTALQEVSLSAPISSIGTVSFLGGLFGIPSCKLGPKIGNPICFGKCITRGHAGGACKGKVCTCVD